MKNIMIFLIFFIFISGCQFIPLFTPIITGIIIWKDGQAHKYYDLDKDIMYRSVKYSLKDLGFKITKEQKSKKKYTIYAESNDKFSVQVDEIKKEITDVSVRVNTFGNKSYVELLYKKIDENLDTIKFDVKGIPVKLQ